MNDSEVDFGRIVTGRVNKMYEEVAEFTVSISYYLETGTQGDRTGTQCDGYSK